MYRSLCAPGLWFLILSVGLCSGAQPAGTKSPGKQKVAVNWRLPGGQRITAVTPTVSAGTLTSPPIGGFTPLLVEVLTDARSTDDDFFAQLESALTGTALSGSPTTNYAIGLFDSGSAAPLVNYCDRLTLGLSAPYMTANPVLIKGVVGQITATVSQPLGVFVGGLDAVDPTTETLNTSNLKGHSNVAVAAAPFENCTDGPEVPTVIGTPLAAFYSTVIKNDAPIRLTLGTTTYNSPTLEFYAPGDPAIPDYAREVPLQLLPPAGDAAYIPTFNNYEPLEFEPASPTVLVGDNTGSLFFALVNLAEGAYSTSERSFMVDTGSQVSVVNSLTAALLGLDPDVPDFTVDIEGIGGSLTDVPGFRVDQLSVVALGGGGHLVYTNAPVVLLDIASPEGGTLEGILGMNLFTDRNLVLAGDLTAPYMLVSDVVVFPGDLDYDHDVDGFDFLTFANCYNGPDRPSLPTCQNPAADIEGDGDVDGFDFLTFANCYNGSDRVPLCP